MLWLTPPLPPQNKIQPSQTASISAQLFLGFPILKGKNPLVAILMGSRSDWLTLRPALNLFRQAGIRVVSAHRTPQRLFTYASSAEKRGLRMILAGAGGAAHLPGMVAALTPLPVLGIPIAGKALRGLDSLLSIAQMPAGIPVATFPIGKKVLWQPRASPSHFFNTSRDSSRQNHRHRRRGPTRAHARPHRSPLRLPHRRSRP